MPILSRRTFLELAGLASAGLLGGCSGGNGITGSDSFSVPVFSDVHFQPFIDPFLPNGTYPNPATTETNTLLVAQLDTADPSDWPAIFKGSLNALNNPPSPLSTDTNYTLLKMALESITSNLGAAPAVLFTGDFLGHGIDQLYPYYSVNPTAAFVDKTLTFVLQQIRAAVGTIPVYFALGNCDSYTGYGPDSTFLASNAQQLYTLALNGAGNQQDVISSLKNGGYYSVEPAGMNLMIVALNTFALSPNNTVEQAMIQEQFAWFDAQLSQASSAGKKVWLLMHAPPGAVESTTGSTSNDINGQIAVATMMWAENYQEQFLGIIGQYPGVIAMSLAGHTHMDEFRLMSPGNALAITAGISPFFGNYPAYKIFTLDSVSLAPIDYSAVNCNLATSSQFNNFYTFSQAYELEGPLATSFAELFPALIASNAAKMQYQGAFYSGNNTDIPNTTTKWNPITSTNWPVYWCGIGYMDEQEFFTAVNAF